MTKKIVSTGLIIGAMISLVGCGSVDDLVERYAPDDDEIAYTGKAYYIDSAVSGVNYTCGSQEGITGADGSFTFEYGSGCTFYLGDMELRGVDSNLLFDGNNVYETDVNIARILQSLDSDGDASNGITIDAEIIEAIAEAGITTLPDTVEELAALEEVLIANELTLVSIDDAQDHLDETVIQLLLAGNTFYAVGQDVNDATDIWGGAATFNADLTEITFIETYGGNGETEIMSISLDGDRLIFGDDSDGSYTTIGENKGDYIEVTDHYSDGTIERNIRFYFDQAKAEAYLESITTSVILPSDSIAITEAMLSGKTFYDTFTEDFSNGASTCYASMTISASLGTRHEICYDSEGLQTFDDSFTFPFVLIDGKLRAEDTNSYNWYTLIAEDGTAWYMINDDDDGKDGTLDSLGEQNTWYLSKPEGFPESL